MSSEMKPGFLTSEWFTGFVVVVTSLLAGIGALGLPDDHPVVKASAFIGAALVSLGYMVVRTKAKDNANKN